MSKHSKANKQAKAERMIVDGAVLEHNVALVSVDGFYEVSETWHCVRGEDRLKVSPNIAHRLVRGMGMEEPRYGGAEEALGHEVLSRRADAVRHAWEDER